MRGVLGLLCVLAGCFFEPPKPAAHGDAGGDAPGDGSGSDVPTCAHWGPWAGEAVLSGLNGSAGDDNEDPAFSPDGTQLVFTRVDATCSTSLYVAAVTGTTFGPASLIFPMASSASWSPSGDRLFFIQSAARTSAAFNGTSFGAGQPDSQLIGLSPAAQGRLTFSGDGTRMYFEVTVTGEIHTFGATGQVGVHWTSTGELSELDSAGASTDQFTPWISSDDLEIFFATSNGNAQLRTATRTSRTAMFGAPMPIANITSDGWRPTLTRDGTLMVFSGADGQLYFTRRSCQ